MSAFNDGQCAKCKRRMGWTGKGTDKPACPKCGHKPTEKELAELASDDVEMERFAALLLKRKGTDLGINSRTSRGPEPGSPA